VNLLHSLYSRYSIFIRDYIHIHSPDFDFSYPRVFLLPISDDSQPHTLMSWRDAGRESFREIVPIFPLSFQCTFIFMILGRKSLISCRHGWTNWYTHDCIFIGCHEFLGQYNSAVSWTGKLEAINDHIQKLVEVRRNTSSPQETFFTAYYCTCMYVHSSPWISSISSFPLLCQYLDIKKRVFRHFHC
jgi:hypothetical protein